MAIRKLTLILLVGAFAHENSEDKTRTAVKDADVKVVAEEVTTAAKGKEEPKEEEHAGQDPMNGDHNMWLTGGFLCMAVSTAMFNMQAKEETKRFNYVAMAVTGIATMAYLAMWSGAGVTVVNGRQVYWMRYVDWFFTTPFFLLDLALLARADVWDTFYVMLLNAVCILCGAIGALNPDAMLPMFFLGMVTFVMFNKTLFGAMMASADSLGGSVGEKYKSVTTMTMAVWCAYPVMYYVCEVTHMVPVATEVMLYAVLDVIAKCAMGFLLLANEDVLQIASRKEPLLA